MNELFPSGKQISTGPFVYWNNGLCQKATKQCNIPLMYSFHLVATATLQLSLNVWFYCWAITQWQIPNIIMNITSRNCSHIINNLRLRVCACVCVSVGLRACVCVCEVLDFLYIAYSKTNKQSNKQTNNTKNNKRSNR